MGAISWVVVANWPATLKPAQQASLAGAFIGTIGTIFAVVAKWYFDQITLQTSHDLSVRGKLLERFYDYSVTYLGPIGSAAGELWKYLTVLRGAREVADTVREQEALHAVVFFLARFIQFQQLLRSNLALENVAQPEGIFLDNRESEELLWGLMIPPWAFGIDTFELESVLIKELTDRNRVEFMSLCKDPASDLHSIAQITQSALVHDWPNKINDLRTTLYAFNSVLNGEVTEVYGSWYRRSVPYPRDALTAALAIPKERRERIGVLYEDRWAIKKTLPWYKRTFRS